MPEKVILQKSAFSHKKGCFIFERADGRADTSYQIDRLLSI